MLPEKITNKIKLLYGTTESGGVAEQLETLLQRHGNIPNLPKADFLTQQDIFLITYADSLQQPGFPPLKSLGLFCRNRLKDLINIVHILPFFPYSSDDGFSVIDYRQVKPSYGDWSDIERLHKDVDLCFDLVLNHVSRRSRYFREFLAGNPKYKDFFITLDPNTDTSSVVRPRALPLLHKYEGADGEKWCWTTFSEDQVDFNFKNPQVLLEILDIMLFYIERGARILRLDAIAYLWKELGTSCVHLEQTHLVVQLMRDILDIIAPHVLLLSETNFPHEENISYFGDGYNEAQMAYNFPMPPLVLQAIASGNSHHLTEWADSIKPVSDRTTFLNFTASHDGIGIRPAATILSRREFDKLIQLAYSHGGQVSFKSDGNGKPIPYELNINYYDALNNPRQSEDEDLEINRFLLSQSIAMVFLGIPAIYIHSLIGSRNWNEGVQQTGQPRSINREKLDLDLLEQQLLDEESRRSRVFHRYKEMIAVRRREQAFHPLARQVVMKLGPAVFALARISRDNTETIIALHNVTRQNRQIKFDPRKYNLPIDGILKDLLGDEAIQADNGQYRITLPAYKFVWLKHSI